MRAMPFGLPGKGVIAVSEYSPEAGGGYWKSCRSKQEGSEPTSVLDTQRSPSPSPPSSTLSSSAEAPGGVAAVSEKPCFNKWPSSEDDVSAAGGGGRGDEWASSELQPVPACLEIGGGGKCGLAGMDDCWDNMLAGSAASLPPPPGHHEHSFFRWFMGDVEDPTSAAASQSPVAAAPFGLVDPGGFAIEPELNPAPVNMNAAMNPASADFFPFAGNNGRLVSACSNLKAPQVLNGGNNGGNPQSPIFSNHHLMNLPAPISLPPGVFFRQQLQQEVMNEKAQLFNPLINFQQTHPAQNPTFLLPLPSFAQQNQPPLLLPPQAKRHHGAMPDPAQFQDPGGFSPPLLPPNQLQLHHLQQRQAKAKASGDEEVAALAQQHQAILGQLCKAAELVEAGNVVLARGILARLNHHQLSSSPTGRPPLLRAAFCFKEALQLLLGPSATTTPPSLEDVVLKTAAYKAFSETSPIVQFANFTCNQALLEALDGFNRIHILDFDIGLGDQWSSFIHELVLKLGGALTLKITALASSTTHDPLELRFTRGNLYHLAADLNVPFEFNVISLDSLDPSSALLAHSDNEAVVVNLPIGTTGLPIPALLRLVRQLKPQIVVSVDHGSDRSELPFSHHFIHSLQSYSILLGLIDAGNMNSEAVQNIEKYLIKPRIESLVSGRHRAGDKLLPWRNLFASAGFSPIPFSNFTETQAECLVKRFPMRGFQVEKRQASLCLLWQRGELVSVSAWRC